ncbi:MAG: programmed cell death 2 domain-containing protein [archaeon]|nr:programmed cell death 2 domain-containing protein [archaeon]
MSNDNGCWPELGYFKAAKGGKVVKPRTAQATTSRLGGGFTPLARTTAAPQPMCVACGEELSLVFFVAAPLPEVTEGRALHVFACTTRKEPGCVSSWAVFREQLPPPSPPQRPAPLPAAPDDWSATPVPSSWDDMFGELDAIGSSQPTAATASAKKQSHKKVGGLVLSYADARVPVRAVAWASEPERAPSSVDDSHVRGLLERYHTDVSLEEEGSGGTDGGGGAAVEDCYEDLTVGWKALRQFEKRAARMPSQCLRYCLGGKPLLYSLLEEHGRVCQRCGGPLGYELQVMPAVMELVKGLEYGTVLVYTCFDSCGDGESATMVEELCIVQKTV